MLTRACMLGVMLDMTPSKPWSLLAAVRGHGKSSCAWHKRSAWHKRGSGLALAAIDLLAPMASVWTTCDAQCCRKCRYFLPQIISSYDCGTWLCEGLQL